MDAVDTVATKLAEVKLSTPQTENMLSIFDMAVKILRNHVMWRIQISDEMLRGIILEFLSCRATAGCKNSLLPCTG